MNSEGKILISTLVIFLVSCLLHFIYDWFPSSFTSLLFPVNESIWEHNKIIMGAFLIWAIIDKIRFKNSNALFNGLISAIICAILVMLIFTPIYLYILETNHNIFITFGIYLISIAMAMVFNYELSKGKKNKTLEKIAIFFWLLIFIANAFLTKYPINKPLFYDYEQNIYGIK